MRFILASASPQRKRLLQEIGFVFEVIPSACDETKCIQMDPALRAMELAKIKSETVKEQNPDAWVLGCDTLVVAKDGTLLEKPNNAEDAQKMIERQSGGVSTVHSAIHLIGPNNEIHTALDSTRIHFRNLTHGDIKKWIDSKLWEDRSGAFQIEGLGQLLLTEMSGDYTGVVGLPISALGKMFREAGISL